MSNNRKHICWITASYFLDTDLPVTYRLMDHFDIDWIIISNEKQKDEDAAYVRSKTNKPFRQLIAPARFYSPALYCFFRRLVLSLKKGNYDLYYFDISDFLFLFPLVRKHLPLDRTIVVTHNVIVPKGARLAPLAKLSMAYTIKTFQHFQTFPMNQRDALRRKKSGADIFYSPFMLKDYGNSDNPDHHYGDPVKFLFFGNILKYKRLDVLLQAVQTLFKRGYRNFKVYITGYCDPNLWKNEYLPLIKNPELFHLDIRRIPNDLVAEYFNTCDYFVMPYQDIAQSGALTVALNYNMPVIASDLPVFHEFINGDEDSFFISPANHMELANAMEHCINLPQEDYLKLKKNLKDNVDSRFSPKTIIAGYIKYLSSFPDA